MTSETGARTSPDNSKGFAKGFTLIELMAVLALFAMLTALSWPAFSGLTRGYALEAAARDLESCLSFARTAAIMDRSRYQVLLHRDPAGYSLYKDDAEIQGAVGRTRAIAPDIALGADRREIEFNPNGTSSAAEISLEDTAGRKIVLKLDGFTGHVTASELEDTVNERTAEGSDR